MANLLVKAALRLTKVRGRRLIPFGWRARLWMKYEGG